MEQPDKLYTLIKSLSKSEKRYFKVQATNHLKKGENNLLKLFELIEGQEQYNEGLLKQQIKGHIILKNFAETKYKLYNALLRSLSQFHKDSTISSQIQQYLHQVEILNSKGLHDQCLAILNKAKKLAMLHEDQLKVLEVIKWEQSIMRATLAFDRIKAESDLIYKQQNKVLLSEKSLNYYFLLYSKMFVALRTTGNIRSKSELQTLEKIINDSFLTNKANANSYHAKNLFHLIHLLYSGATGNFNTFYLHAKKRLELMEAHPHHIKDALLAHINGLSDFLVACNQLNNSEEFDKQSAKLRKLQQQLSSKKLIMREVKSLTRSYTIETDALIRNGKFNNNTNLLKEIKEYIKKHKVYIDKSDEIILYFNMSYMFFGNEEYKEALTWINQALNETNIELRQDVQSAIRFFNLIIHYELGNTDLLEYVVKSTYRFLLKRQRLYKHENIVLNFIRKEFPKIKSSSELTNAFKELRKALIKILKDPFEAKALEYFDTIAWLDSKIENLPFAEIIQRKALSSYHSK